jgi:phage gp45-like
MITEMIRSWWSSFRSDPTASASRTANLDGRPEESIVTRSFQHYGFSSWPKAGIECVTVKHGNLSAVVAEEQTVKLTDMAEGDVVLYVDATHYIRIKADGTMSIKTDKDVTVDAATANVVVKAGSIKLGSDNSSSDLFTLLTDAFATAFNTHTHPVPGITTGTSSTTSSAPLPGITQILNPTAFTSVVKAK